MARSMARSMAPPWLAAGGYGPQHGPTMARSRGLWGQHGPTMAPIFAEYLNSQEPDFDPVLYSTSLTSFPGIQAPRLNSTSNNAKWHHYLH